MQGVVSSGGVPSLSGEVSIVAQELNRHVEVIAVREMRRAAAGVGIPPIIAERLHVSKVSFTSCISREFAFTGYVTLHVVTPKMMVAKVRYMSPTITRLYGIGHQPSLLDATNELKAELRQVFDKSIDMIHLLHNIDQTPEQSAFNMEVEL